MRLGNGNFVRKAVLLIAPIAVLGGPAAYAQSYGYYDDSGHATRHHERDEKRDLKQHQREERRYYGNSWELRQHQNEERHELKHHQRHERGYDNGYYGRDGYSRRDYYDRNRY